MYQKTLICSDGIRFFFLLFFFSLFTFYGAVAQNSIVTENALPGTPASVWDIPSGDAGDLSIQGFATDISVNKGGTVDFKIDVNSGGNTNFNVDIYRIGYYQGNGARLIEHIPTTFTGTAQSVNSPCSVDNTNTTGLIDCGNWKITVSWNVPATAVSGLYIAKLTKVAGGGTSHIPFVVRDDASTSKLFFKTSDATWQAYNGYGGNSLYVGPGMPFNHGNKVSYNRPFITRSGGGGGGAHEDWFMNAEYPMIRFLEKNGYDISYTTDVDIARNNSNNVNLLLNHPIFLSVGHDEYWSKEVRNSVEAARTAGIHLAFFSGNEIYWKTRWENSVDGSATPFRTMVCYKEGTLPTPQENACGGKCDGSTNEWTGLWRDGCGYPGVTDACKPENALSGEISWDGTTDAITVQDTYKNLRFWRNTPQVANLASGATYALPDGTLGYEWDWEQFQSSYPLGRITMSNTNSDGHIHKLSLYKASSGSIVFGAGTVQWAWGLDQNHDLNIQGGGGPADQNLQQATVNVLSDMGAQPATIQSGLITPVQSTDVTPPVSIITAPVNGSSITAGTAYTITGTSSDVGGIVAGVDISVDGGLTWQVATGTTSWSFAWTPTVVGAVTIKTRAFDDIGNLEAPGGNEGSANTVNVIVVPGTPPTNCPCFIFNTPGQGPAASDIDQNDGQPLNLGVKFRAAFDGTISAIKFYKSTTDNRPITVQLWTLDGSQIGIGTLATSASGWVTANLTAPVNISANVTYVASYFSPSGFYAATDNGFATAIVNGALIGIATSDPDGPNGVYIYGGSPAFPINTFHASNYWVDVVYDPTTGPDITPPVVVFTFPTTDATGVNINSFVSATFSEFIDPSTVTNLNFELKDASNAVIPATVTYSVNSRTITLVPSTPPLDYSSVYTATVKGGSSGIKDLAGNAMVSDFTWSFTTADPPPIPPDEGAGGPLLVISSSTNPFSRYLVEILRSQGYTSFKAVDITEVRNSSVNINDYDVILLGNFTNITTADVSLLTAWTNAGGTLIAQKPAPLLLPLMGVTANGATHDQYLKVNTTAGQPGAGIVNQTIQFHGAMDQYTMLAGTTALATLYQDANTNTIFPAITSVNVGQGKAIAFAYDLAKSVVFTRQGDPTQTGKNNDGQSGPYRSDDLFMPNWIDFNKIQIPQADEQQHLLTNIILLDNLQKKPLPHLWILPRGLKAAVVMTGDDHHLGLYPGTTGTAGRFNEYRDLSTDNSLQGVTDWNVQTIRGTSYVYDDTPIPDDSVAYYQSLGFEIALHPNTNCTNFTPSSLSSTISSQLSLLQSQFPSMTTPVTNRTHCLPWSDWATHPKVENTFGMRLDVNYYYWPGSWIQNRPGMFTGSGMPMRFADVDGTIIDCYQAPTQMPDESGLDIANSINTLLDNAINLGYYGAFVMNMHTDTAIHVGSDEVIAAAQLRNIPVISAKQMLEWLDSRNNTAFSNMTWDNLTKILSFHLSTAAHNLQVLVPVKSVDGTLIDVKENGTSIFTSVSNQTIKGIGYAFFNGTSNDYQAIYSSSALPVTFLKFAATKQGDNALLNWTTSMEENNKGFEIQRSTDQSGWTVLGFVAGAGNSQTPKDYQYLDKDLPAGTYYYRLRQVDFDNRSVFSKTEQVTFNGDLALDLKQNRPNPFNGNTTIDIIIPKASNVELILYDEMGRPLRVLMDEFKSPGRYSISMDKGGLSTGIYYYRMNALGQSLVKKMNVY